MFDMTESVHLNDDVTRLNFIDIFSMSNYFQKIHIAITIGRIQMDKFHDKIVYI